MKICIISIPVQDQQKALKFYTEKLGFIKKQDIPMGEENRWLTVVAKEQQERPELLLEPSPNHFGPADTYPKALFDAGIPYTQFSVENVHQEYEHLNERGETFTTKPTEMGNTTVAVFDDTCGNLIQIVGML